MTAKDMEEALEMGMDWSLRLVFPFCQIMLQIVKRTIACAFHQRRIRLGRGQRTLRGIWENASR